MGGAASLPWRCQRDAWEARRTDSPGKRRSQIERARPERDLLRSVPSDGPVRFTFRMGMVLGHADDLTTTWSSPSSVIIWPSLDSGNFSQSPNGRVKTWS